MEVDENTDNGSNEKDKLMSASSDSHDETEGARRGENENGDVCFKKPTAFAIPSMPGKRKVNIDSDKETSLSTDTPVTREHSEKAPNDTELPAADRTSKEKNVDQDVVDKNSDTSKVKPLPTRTTQDVSSKSKIPAGKFKPNPPLPYTEPPWGGVPKVSYALEILKNGAIVDSVPLSQQGYFVVGRLPLCDVALEHPSISRYHAVLQHRGQSGESGEIGEEQGFYVYDLSSTHGTFVNKNRVPPKTYIRLKVGHVLKFGGSTRLFILQGPESDEEAESELTVTELRERARKQRELEERMTGDGSDEEKEKDESEKPTARPAGDTWCSWGIGDEAAPEDENEENPFATEFQEDQSAAYLKDPKKALQGFYDREGEELEFEYEEKGHGTWLCRVRLPVDDAHGRQLIAEVTHSGRKKEASIQCSLEACRILEARGLLRQEATSRKRKKKNWEEEDFYSSDDDAFLDRTGTVEMKRKERMKRAGKIAERPDSFDSLTAKFERVQQEIAEMEKKLQSSNKSSCLSSSEDSLDDYMRSVCGPSGLDGVERKKLHVHIAELRKEAQRLQGLLDLTRPTQLPSLSTSGGSTSQEKTKKALPLFGAMKGGSKFKLKTGTIGALPAKKPSLPPELFNMKELPPEVEEEEEEEEEGEEEKMDETSAVSPSSRKPQFKVASSPDEVGQEEPHNNKSTPASPPASPPMAKAKAKTKVPSNKAKTESPQEDDQTKPSAEMPDNSEAPKRKSQTKGGKKKAGPARAPVALSTKYPDDDPDYCVWVPPSGQTGDGRTHLNDKFGY